MKPRRIARVRALQALYSRFLQEKSGAVGSGFAGASGGLGAGGDRSGSTGLSAPSRLLEDLRLHYPRGNEKAPAWTAEDMEGVEDETLTARLVTGVVQHFAAIDALIRQAAQNWRPERMDVVDLCLIQIGAYELAYCADIPAAVSINEAVELARRYGSAHSGSFVNGVLDRIRHNLTVRSAESGESPENV
jgi:transcription antitermination factor NusB